MKKTSKRGFPYYGCEKAPACSFMTWDVPTAEVCPECGKTMFKRSGRGNAKPFCINEACSRFLPEDQRGYRRKKAADKEKAEEAPENEAAEQKKTKQGTRAAKKKNAAKTKAKTAAKPRTRKTKAPTEREAV